MAEAFVDINDRAVETSQTEGTGWTNYASVEVGKGSKVFRCDKSGLWLGAEKWADAPFRVDMDGNLVASSVSITGYIPTGGAAADVNAGSTTISGGKITTNSITLSHLNFTPLTSSGTTSQIIATINASAEGITIGASKISISGSTTFSSGYDPSTKVAAVGGVYVTTATAAASKVQIFPDANTGIVAYASNGTSVVFKVEVGGTNVGDVTIGNYAGGYGALWDQSAGTLKIKGNIEAGNIDAARITSGTLSTSRIPNLSADKITSGYLSASRIEAGSLNASVLGAGTINASVITVSNISATNITTGTLTVSGSSVSRIVAGNSGNSDTGYYTWSGGSKIWVDSSGYMGQTATGERFYFYTGSVLYALFQRGSQAGFYAGISCQGSFNVGAVGDHYNARFSGNVYMYESGTSQYFNSDSDDMRYYSADNHEFYKGSTIKAIIDENIWTQGTYYQGCAAFIGEPFSVLETVKGENEEKMGLENALIPLDHKKLHPLLKADFKDKSGKKQNSMSLSGLVNIQNKAILELNRRLSDIEKGIK